MISNKISAGWLDEAQAVRRRISQCAFFGISALCFAASAAVTIVWCAPMSRMGMPMPGAWTMSMAWMRMPAQTWPDAAGAFLGMWVAMMIAMMLPSLLPILSRYRRAVAQHDDAHVGWRTFLTAAGYFFVWTVLGIAIYLVGVTLASLEMEHPGLAQRVPAGAGFVVLIAGAFQITPWKTRLLGRCGYEPISGCILPAAPRAAWRRGVRLGLDCSYCCAGLMAILLVAGVMDLRAMAIVMALITIERLLPSGAHVARVTGVLVIAVGLFLIARAIRHG